jgi:hypothetical protein
MAHNDGEKTISHIMKTWKFQRQLPSDSQSDDNFQADLEVLNLINILRNQNLNQTMIKNINTLILVNELSETSLETYSYKQKITDNILNYFTNKKKRIVQICTQQGKGFVDDISNLLDQGNSLIILDPFERYENVFALSTARDVITYLRKRNNIKVMDHDYKLSKETVFNQIAVLRNWLFQK